MVDFGAGTSVFEGALPPSTPIVNPVDDKSGETFASALASGVEGFSNFLIAGKEARVKAEAEQAKGSVFVQLDDLINRYADARDQGVSTDEIMRRLRVDINGLVANNPTMADDIHIYAGRMLSDNGMGGSILKETPAEAAARKEQEDAAAMYLTVDQYREYKQVMNNNLIIGERLKSIELSGQAVTASDKAQATVALHSLVNSSTNMVVGRIQAAYAELANVTDPAQRAAIIEQVKTDININVTSKIGQLKASSGSSMDLSYLTKGIEDLTLQFQKVADGTITKEAYDKEVAGVKARITATIYSKPEVAAGIILNEEYKGANPAVLAQVTADSMEMMYLLGMTPKVDAQGNPLGDKVPDVTDTKEKLNSVFQLSKGMMESVLDGTNTTPESINQTNIRVGNMLTSVAKYGAAETDPRNFSSVANYLADPVFGKYIIAHPEALTSTAAVAARDIIDRQYGDVVLNLVGERWNAAVTEASSVAPELTQAELGMAGFGMTSLTGLPSTSPEKVDISMAIQPVWNGAGIEFRVGDKWKSNAELQRIARELNVGQDAIAPAINGLIRLSSHLGGTTDYKKVYEDKFAPRLWVGGNTDQTAQAQPQTRGITPQELTDLNNVGINLQDFTGGVEEPIIKKTDAVPRSDGNKEGLFAYLVKGKPDSYITDLNPDFASSLSSMLNDMPPELAGKVLINSGARSNERQAALWQEALVKYGSEAAARKWVAPPGKSMHNHGTAADLAYLSPAALKWVHDNAQNYGLHFPLGNENWHIEPIGSRG